VERLVFLRRDFCGRAADSCFEIKFKFKRFYDPRSFEDPGSSSMVLYH